MGACIDVEHRRLGRTNFDVSVIGFGAFKIGRTLGMKYPRAYELPTEDECARLLGDVLDLGINLIDTAPAYGVSEERIGRHLAHRRSDFILSTKVGEMFDAGTSTYDFSSGGIRRSVQRSLKRLQTDYIDILFIHSDGNDIDILENVETVSTMVGLRESGLVRAVGFSGKTVEGATQALAWADVLMVELNQDDDSHTPVILESDGNFGVVVKKGLASGHHAPETAIPYVLNTPGVDSLVIGGLNIDHLKANVAIAESTAAD